MGGHSDHLRLASGLTAVVALSGLLWAVSTLSPAAAQEERKPKQVVVEMSLVGGYSPSTVEIRTGTTVVWRNEEPLDYPVVGGRHKVVADDGSFESPQVPPGQSWAHTFLKPGEFSYDCANHAHMTGTIVVKGPPVSEKEAERERTIEIVERDPNDQDSWGYKPADITIEVGTTVTWVNTGAQEHSATSDDGAFDSGLLASGESYSFTFDEPGVYDYHCEPHPWMTATIRVAEAGEEPPPDEGDSESASSPAPPPPASESEGGGPTTHHVNIVEGESTSDWGFDPATLEIEVGDTVVWENTGSVEHTATADDGTFDSGLLGTGETFEHTFEEGGTYAYHCEPHPFMTATITVSESASPGGTQGAGGPTSVGGASDGSQDGSERSTAAAAGPRVSAAAEAGAGLDWKWALVLAFGTLWVTSSTFLLVQWKGEPIKA